jgi:hypothetical protein
MEVDREIARRDIATRLRPVLLCVGLVGGVENLVGEVENVE